MKPITKQQQIQEHAYAFPYHYITSFRNGFRPSIHDRYGIDYVAVLEHVLEHIARYSPRSVCDIGAGDGRFTRELTCSFPDARIVGVDYSARAIGLARAMNPHIRYVHADVADTTIAETFEMLTMIDVFEHIPPADAPRFVEALNRMLEPDGVLILTVPHKKCPVSAKHFRHFDSCSLAECFEGRFRIEDTTFLLRRRYLKKVIQQILKNKLFLTYNRWLLNTLYSLYKKTCFIAAEETCRKICMSLRKQ